MLKKIFANISFCMLCFGSDGTASLPPLNCQPLDACVPSCSTVCPNQEWNFFLIGDWLYWKPFSEGYDYALINQQNFATTTSHRFFVNQKPLDIDFDFSSNYRVVGGAFLPSAKEHILIKFTHVQGDASANKTAYGDIVVSDPGVLGIQLYRTWTLGSDTFANPGVVHAKKWIKYLAGDLEFGKLAWQQSFFSLLLAAGVRAVDLKNEMSIHFETTPNLPNAYTLSGLSDMKIMNKFRGAGLRVGTSLNFQLHKSFVWSNELDASLVLGKFKMRQDELFNQSSSQANPPPNPPIPESAKSRLNQLSLKPNIQLATSLGYSFTGFKHDITLKVGYEIDYWLNMNQMTRFVSEGTAGVLGQFFYVREKGDVYFHGVFGEAGVSF